MNTGNSQQAAGTIISANNRETQPVNTTKSPCATATLPGAAGCSSASAHIEAKLPGDPGGTADSSASHFPPSTTTSENRRCFLSNKRISEHRTTADNTEAKPVTKRPTLRTAAIAFLLALSALFGLKGYLDNTSTDLPEAQAASTSPTAPTLDTIPIEHIRVGQRVLTSGADPDTSLPTAVDEQTWRHLTLEQTDTWPDGTVDRICVESLMPPEWLALHEGAPVGSTVPIPLDLEEMGLPEGMTANVVANQPCPPIEQGPGRVVLTTVNHLNPQVVELTLVGCVSTHQSPLLHQSATNGSGPHQPSGSSNKETVDTQHSLPSEARGRAGEGAEVGQVLPSTSHHAVASTPQATNESGPLQPSASSVGCVSTHQSPQADARAAQETVRPTAHHKFYSETRDQWLSAQDLQPGERLRGLNGTLQVVSTRPIPGTHRVYNMTVEGEHVYHVSTLGVLAHNNRCRVGYSREYAEGFDRIQRAPTGSVSRYTRDTFEGRNVYRAADDFDLSVPTNIDPKYVHKSIRTKIDDGWTNADLMRNGNAPIGHDGRPINLHHVLGDEPGPMLEILGSTHKQFHGPLHGLIEDGNSFRNVPGLESQYKSFQKRYWKWRIEQLAGN